MEPSLTVEEQQLVLDELINRCSTFGLGNYVSHLAVTIGWSVRDIAIIMGYDFCLNVFPFAQLSEWEGYLRDMHDRFELMRSTLREISLLEEVK